MNRVVQPLFSNSVFSGTWRHTAAETDPARALYLFSRISSVFRSFSSHVWFSSMISFSDIFSRSMASSPVSICTRDSLRLDDLLANCSGSGIPAGESGLSKTTRRKVRTSHVKNWLEHRNDQGISTIGVDSWETGRKEGERTEIISSF